MNLPYEILDVFTATPFGGNQLAVVRPEAPLDDALMQRIAAEFGFSETVFITPGAADADFRLRIFTPRMELHFAGHPIIGAAVALGQGATRTLTLRVNTGAVSVEVDGNTATLTVPTAPEIGPSPPPRLAVADLIGLRESDLTGSLAPVSFGTPFLLVQVKDEAALNRAECDVELWRSVLRAYWAPHIYLYCEGPGADLTVRMFAPAMGIVEDPATGAGAAALAAHLAMIAPESDIAASRVIHQGARVGRPSVIRVEYAKAGGRVHRVRVGGQAVLIATGTLLLP